MFQFFAALMRVFSQKKSGQTFLFRFIFTFVQIFKKKKSGHDMCI